MATYYISAIGCDTNDGLTPDTPWQTIKKVNSSVVGGDTVCFRCGDTFFGQIPFVLSWFQSHWLGLHPFKNSEHFSLIQGMPDTSSLFLLSTSLRLLPTYRSHGGAAYGDCA